MAIADANIILRYILNDHEELSAKAAEIIENNTITLTIEVEGESIFTFDRKLEKYIQRQA